MWKHLPPPFSAWISTVLSTNVPRDSLRPLLEVEPASFFPRAVPFCKHRSKPTPWSDVKHETLPATLTSIARSSTSVVESWEASAFHDHCSTDPDTRFRVYGEGAKDYALVQRIPFSSFLSSPLEERIELRNDPRSTLSPPSFDAVSFHDCLFFFILPY